MPNSENKASIAGREVGDESLAGLLGRVGEDLATLLDAKLGLLKIEIEEDIRAYARGGVAIGVGSVIAAVGFALLTVGIGFVISALFEQDSAQPPDEIRARVSPHGRDLSAPRRRDYPTQ
jgi:hypothetical protein